MKCILIRHLSCFAFLLSSLLLFIPQAVVCMETQFEQDINHAASSGSLRELQEFLDAGADVMTKDKLGGTPLHAAANNGHDDACTLLLDNGAEVNDKNKYGNTPLHLTALKGLESTALLLLRRGADKTLQNNAQKTAEQLAQPKNHENIVKLLNAVLEEEFKETLELHAAVAQGDEQAVRDFIDAGVDITEVNERGETALHVAARKGNEVIWNLLIENGADKQASNAKNETPAIIAVNSGHKHLLGLAAKAMSAGNSASSLNSAKPEIQVTARQPEPASSSHAMPGSNREQKAVVRKVEPIIPLAGYAARGYKATAAEKDNLLHKALNKPTLGIKEKDVTNARQLIMSRQFDLDARGNDGATVLSKMVAFKEWFPLIKLAFEYGVKNVDPVGTTGRTPLFNYILSSYLDDLDICTLFIMNGANVNALDCSGTSMLFELSKTGPYKRAKMKILLEAGAHVNQMCPIGKFYERYALSGEPSSSYVLPSDSFSDNVIPFFNICALCDRACRELMIEHGAAINAITNKKKDSVLTFVAGIPFLMMPPLEKIRISLKTSTDTSSLKFWEKQYIGFIDLAITQACQVIRELAPLVDNINHRNKDNQSVLGLMSILVPTKLEFIEVLLEHGADPCQIPEHVYLGLPEELQVLFEKHNPAGIRKTFGTKEEQQAKKKEMDAHSAQQPGGNNNNAHGVNPHQARTDRERVANVMNTAGQAGLWSIVGNALSNM